MYKVDEILREVEELLMDSIEEIPNRRKKRLSQRLPM